MSVPKWFRGKRPTSPTSATILSYLTQMDLSLVPAISWLGSGLIFQFAFLRILQFLAKAQIARTELTYKPTVYDPFVTESNETQFYDDEQLTEDWTELSEFNCSDPPVPANAQIASYADFNVTYKCNDPFVVDPNGPQLSTCDRLTGHWTDPPICVCVDPPVPANGQIVSQTDFSVQVQSDAPFLLNWNYTAVCDETGTWDQLPSCNYRWFPFTLNMFHIWV